jgi:hypothetical protein
MRRRVLPTVACVSGGSALAAAIALAGPQTGSASSPPAKILGEVHVNGPERPNIKDGEIERRAPAPFRVRVALTVEARASRKVIRRMTVTSDTRFAVAVAPGTYRVRAEIGPPTVNPVPRPCGTPRLLTTHTGHPAFVKLSCDVTG